MVAMGRLVSFFLGCSLLALIGCAADDGAVTDDGNELVEARGALERELDPRLDPPEDDRIGADIDAVFEKIKTTAGTAQKPEKQSSGCTRTQFKSAKTKTVSAERVTCKQRDTIRVFNADGEIEAEHTDLNGDGKVDRFSSETGPIAQLLDTDFNGVIDTISERVSQLKDFSLTEYGDEKFPKSTFAFRIRQDLNHDRKLDHEKMTAPGGLPH